MYAFLYFNEENTILSPNRNISRPKSQENAKVLQNGFWFVFSFWLPFSLHLLLPLRQTFLSIFGENFRGRGGQGGAPGRGAWPSPNSRMGTLLFSCNEGKNLRHPLPKAPKNAFLTFLNCLSSPDWLVLRAVLKGWSAEKMQVKKPA